MQIDGKGKVTGAGAHLANKKVTLKATASKGYAFAGWYLGGELVTKSASYSFKATGEDADYRARFVTLAGTVVVSPSRSGEDTASPLTMTVGSTGKVSGKYTLDGAKWTFSAKSFSSAEYDELTHEPHSFAANVTASATINRKKKSQKLVVTVTEEGVDIQVP